MNKTPSILVDTGFEVDQNGGLTEIIFPRVVSALNAPRKVTCEGDTINYIPSTAAALQEFEFHGTAYIGSLVRSYTNLTTVYFPNCETLGQASSASNGEFYGCTRLATVNMPKLKYINCYATNGDYGTFCNCTSLTSIELPELLTITQNQWGGIFNYCYALTTVNFPKLQSISGNQTQGAFRSCTGLQTVTLGSEGHAVTSLHNYAFSGCTQSGLTITVYTQGGAALSGSPWGATNATIVYEEA